VLNWWLPENVSTYGRDIDWLFHVIYWITGITFVLVAAAMLTFVVIYRDRPGRRARYTHGSTPLEIAWTIAPAIILVVLTILSAPAWSRIKMTRPPSDFVVRVTAKQFNWQVAYPGGDGTFDGGDAKQFLDEMHVPANKVIHVQLRSQDVIHSLFVPSFRIKQDAVPGRTIIVWFEATKPGKYEWPCAELCGFGHSGMRGWVYVHSAADWAKWAAENLHAEAVPSARRSVEATKESVPAGRTAATKEGKGKS